MEVETAHSDRVKRTWFDSARKCGSNHISFVLSVLILGQIPLVKVLSRADLLRDMTRTIEGS